MRKRYLNQKLSFEEDRQKRWRQLLLEEPEQGKWFCYWQINLIQEKINKLQKNIYFINKLISGKENSKFQDLEVIRQIPIKQIMESFGYKPIERNKYLCPIHNEKTPSFHLREKENKFKCFGCGVGGSNIDLVMHIRKCDCGEAIKYLSTMI